MAGYEEGWRKGCGFVPGMGRTGIDNGVDFLVGSGKLGYCIYNQVGNKCTKTATRKNTNAKKQKKWIISTSNQKH
jgi:hypothetical protein